jgi:N-acetylmuramoyl-L-alanine amidase
MRKRVATSLLASLLALGGLGVVSANDVAAYSTHRAHNSMPARRTVSVAALRPPIVWHPFGYTVQRRREMGAYSKRHYGVWSWRLTDPRVIVEHYTAGTSVTSVFNYYAANSVHLGELPGVCAHFVIDTDGTIYQEAPLTYRCRHVVGINDTAIGIEHVGTSDGQILHNPAMMRASLRLTLWLMARYGIQLRNVIGHAESLMSPYHHELYPSWRCQTHADWQHADMRTYRALLRARADAAGVPVGPHPRWVDPHC